MKTRSLIIGLVASLAAAASFALPTAVSAHTNNGTPYINEVDIKMVVPSTIGSSGNYQLEVLAADGFSMCSFYLYRYTEDYWGGWQYLGDFSGSTYFDNIIPSEFGSTEYEMIPLACNSVSGAGTYSDDFYPTIQDDPFGSISGHLSTVYSGKYYGGDAQETTTPGAEVYWYDNCTYNDGVVIGTGPQGGIGTVYVNGVRSGTINFYSKKVAGKKEAFKYGTYDGQCNEIVIEAGRGTKGGYSMYLDAALQNED
jgi:hypothetical protein